MNIMTKSGQRHMNRRTTVVRANCALFALAASSAIIAPQANAQQSHYGVTWSDKSYSDIRALGYNPEELSRYMYERNDRCSKSVSSVSKNQQFVCIQFSCGFFTWSYVIDEWRKEGKVDPNGACTW